MQTYEITYIISPQLKSQEIDEIKKEVETFIKEKEGVILKSEKMPVQTLTYPIKKQNSGYFTILEIKILEDKIKELKEKLEKNDKILRHLVLVKNPVKEMKARRIRKPLATPPHQTNTESSIFKHIEHKKKEEGVDLEKIDEKIDEILSE